MTPALDFASGMCFELSEVIVAIAPLWCSHDPFPLTPALSLRERAGVRGNGPRKLRSAGGLQLDRVIRVSDFIRLSSFRFRISLAWLLSSLTNWRTLFPRVDGDAPVFFGEIFIRNALYVGSRD